MPCQMNYLRCDWRRLSDLSLHFAAHFISVGRLQLAHQVVEEVAGEEGLKRGVHVAAEADVGDPEKERD